MNAYLDGSSGVAGDMILGALTGLGLPSAELNQILHRALKEKRFKVMVKRTERQTWPAWSVTVKGDRHFGSIAQMRALVARSPLPSSVKRRSLAILTTLESAERQAHGASHSSLDPQGLGLLDTLVDVVGCSWGFWKLGIESLDASALNTGRIAPATAVMLRESRLPIYSDQQRYELATPTGVAILLHIVSHFSPLPPTHLAKAGYGAGQLDMAGKPNVLAIYQSVSDETGGSWPRDRVVLLETAIDDMDPRLYPHVTDLLFKAGALDVWWAPVGMKKGRPGIAFSVLCPTEKEQGLLQILFHETTTLGVRRLPLERYVLPRERKGLLKTAILAQGQIKQQVEFELARKKAQHLSIPLRKLLK